MKRLMKDTPFFFYWSALAGFAVVLVLVLNVPPTLGQASKPAVDLNSASEKELEALPGVDPAVAKKITANRPYKSVDELSKAGLTAKEIEILKPLVLIGAGSAPPIAGSFETLPKARRARVRPREYAQ